MKALGVIMLAYHDDTKGHSGVSVRNGVINQSEDCLPVIG